MRYHEFHSLRPLHDWPYFLRFHTAVPIKNPGPQQFSPVLLQIPQKRGCYRNHTCFPVFRKPAVRRHLIKQKGIFPRQSHITIEPAPDQARNRAAVHMKTGAECPHCGDSGDTPLIPFWKPDPIHFFLCRPEPDKQHIFFRLHSVHRKPVIQKCIAACAN